MSGTWLITGASRGFGRACHGPRSNAATGDTAVSVERITSVECSPP
ncbi:hypothetical protein [Streptomyces phaeoluteigriseus]|nr:hypothetical protein [Streptomyces phaeoluteigriseus]